MARRAVVVPDAAGARRWQVPWWHLSVAGCLGMFGARSGLGIIDTHLSVAVDSASPEHQAYESYEKTLPARP